MMLSHTAAATLRKSLILTLLVLVAALMMFPLVWMMSTSLKPIYKVMTFPPELWPSPMMWSNYAELFQHYPVARSMSNTVYITAMNIVGKLLSCTIVAYGFAKYRAPGRDFLFMLLLATMMIPWAVTMVPLFILYKEIGWYDTFLPLWVPAFFGDAFSIFLLRQFILAIPRELEEAARIDGAGVLRLIGQVIVPNIKPALTVVALFSFFHTWNDFLGPLLFLSDSDKATLQIAIQNMRTQFTIQWNLMMALSVVSVVPCLVVFFFGQKQLVEGITLTGVK